MKSRILSIVLAISMIAVLFAALPTRGAVTYTGTVITTDTSGIPKTDFLQGELVYVNVTVMKDGVPAPETFFVSLQRADNGNQVSSFTQTSDDPVVGVYNSTIAPTHSHLHTGSLFDGDVMAYNLIVTVYGNKIAEVQIIVRATGLTLVPDPDVSEYWPGEEITATLVVTEAETAVVFYVQVLNATNAQTGLNWTDQTALSGYWSKKFQIAATMPDGTYYMNVRAKLDNSPMYSVHFHVQAFDLIVNTDRFTYLPGETAVISYVAQDLATLSQVSSGLTFTTSVEYENKTGNTTWKNGTLPITENIWSLVLPTNGTAPDSIGLFSNVYVTITAKQAAGNRIVEEQLTLSVGLPDATVDLENTVTHEFVPGDTVVATVSAYIEHWWNYLPGANVALTVLKNGTQVVYSATSLVTDQYGKASYAFTLSNTAAEGNYIVKATVSKLIYSIQRDTQFSVGANRMLAASWDKEYYSGGETATITFEPVLNGAVATVSSVGYVIGITGQVLAAANTTTLSASVTVPEGYSGVLYCRASTLIDGMFVDSYAVAEVKFAELGLTPLSDHYRPGDTITFQWSIVTSVTTATLTYEILDDKGVRVATGGPEFAKTGSFEYTVPDAGPLLSELYTARMWMTTTSGGFRSAEVTVHLVAPEELVIWIGDSKYASGEFAPGQKVTIHYQLDANLFEARPLIRLHLSTDWDPAEWDYVTDTATGTITYTIPKNTPLDSLYIHVHAYDAATGDALGSDTTAVVVNDRLGGWDMSIGGMSAIDFTLLVLLIIVIVMLIVVPLLKGRMGAPKPPEPAPPAEAGKVPPP